MSPVYRRFASLCALAVVAAAALAALELGGCGHSVTEDFHSIADSWALQARQDEQLGQIEHRSAKRRRLVEELIDGKRGLVEVAACFDRLNADAPGADTDLAKFLGPSRGERVCRQVIDWARNLAEARSPGFADEVTHRLEGELARHLRGHGTVELPPVP